MPQNPFGDRINLLSRIWTKEEVEEALNRPWYAFALPHGLEELFHEKISDARRRTLRLQLILVFGFSFALLSTSAQTALFSFDLKLQLVFMLPICSIGFIVLSRRCAPSLQFYATAIPILISLTLTIVVGRYANDLMYNRYIMAAGNLIVIWNIIMPRCPRRTALFAVLNQIIFVTGFIAWRASGRPIGDLICVYTMLNAFSLIVCLRSERGARNIFLYQLRHSLQTEELKLSNAELKKLSGLDALTGIANRRSFDAALTGLFSASPPSTHCIGILMIDVDFFKSFNDTAGHLAGDRCLLAIADTLAAEVRSDDHLIARFGGEEFAILVENADPAQTGALANRVVKAVERRAIPHPGQAPGACVTVSIGIAMAPAASGPASDLVMAADCALYEAKRMGRNRSVMYDRAYLARGSAA